MKTRLIAVLIIFGFASGLAQAQEATSGPPRLEVSIFPGGGTFFSEGSDTGASDFGNYSLGGALTFNFSRYVGVEAEVSGILGITQDLTRGGLTSNLKSPDMVNYTGNVVFSLPNTSSVVPYVTAGVGGLTLLDKASLDINDPETFLTENVGGGVKWYAGRWGLRADYRFIAVNSKDDAPAFWGNDVRYGHRVYGGIILNIAR